MLPSRSLLHSLQSIPSAIVDLRLQLPADQARHPVIEHRVADHRVISLLVEEELSPMTQLRIRLSILVDVWRWCEGPRQTEEVHYRTLAHVEENSNVSLTPGISSQ